MWPFKSSERDPTLTQVLARLVELENEWRAFLTQQQRWHARLAKRDRDAALAVAQVDRAEAGPPPQDRKAVLRQRARQLMFPGMQRKASE